MPFRVYYLHLRNYYVYRPCKTIQEARGFIRDNALVHPLPGVYVTEVISYFPFEEVEVTLLGGTA